MDSNTCAPTLPPSSCERLVGHRFGSFVALRELGRGGMGTVLLAEHALIPKRVAVKVLHRHLAEEPELVARFLAEARAMSLVQHENVVSVHDFEAHGERPWFVMEYLEGQSLADVAREPLAPRRVVELLLQVCDALGAAHAHGIIHRDLKPANLYLARGPQGRERVKLLDFGIAKRLVLQEGETPTRTGVLMGTPEFMAPEQCEGGEVDARTDLYAVGVLGYLLLSGRAPFTGTNAAQVLLAHLRQAPRPLQEVRPDTPPALAEVVLRALAKRPEERFSSAAELRAALEAALAPRPSTFTARGPDGREYPCERVGRTGLFLRTGEPSPPLLSELPLVLKLPGGELPCAARVVRHVSADQALAWNMAPGFAVELREASPSFQHTLSRLLAGERPVAVASPAAAEASSLAESVLREVRPRMEGDLYAFLGVPRDADSDTVRARARALRERLEPLRALALSPGQGTLTQRALTRVAEAWHVLGHLERRVAYDAELPNPEGILRCLSSGLTITALEACRQRFLARHPKTQGHSVLHLTTGKAYLAARRPTEALAAFEAALRVDPLHLEALRSWHSLRSRLRAGLEPEVPRSLR